MKQWVERAVRQLTESLRPLPQEHRVLARFRRAAIGFQRSPKFVRANMEEWQPQVRLGAAAVADDSPISAEAKRERAFFHKIADHEHEQRLVRSCADWLRLLRRIHI